MKIGYWGIKGRGEALYCLAKHLGVEFEEVRIMDKDKWFGEIKPSLGMDFPSIPYLIDGDFTLSETAAIATYIVGKSGKLEYGGKTPQDRARITEILSIFSDIFEACRRAISSSGGDKAKITEALAALAKEGLLSDKVKNMSAFLGDKDFFLGYPTVADIMIGINHETIELFYKSLGLEPWFLAHDNLKALFDRVHALPGISERYNSPAWKMTPWLPPGMLPFDMLLE